MLRHSILVYFFMQLHVYAHSMVGREQEPCVIENSGGISVKWRNSALCFSSTPEGRNDSINTFTVTYRYPCVMTSLYFFNAVLFTIIESSVTNNVC